MFNVRSSMFETNSSSLHSFLVPPDTNIQIPSTVVLGSRNYDLSDPVGRINLIYQQTRKFGCSDAFIGYLLSKGINVELKNVEDRLSSFCSCYDIRLEDLDQICFNPSLIDDETDPQKFEKYLDESGYRTIDFGDRDLDSDYD